MTLGMGKRKISMILFIETIIIGLLSLGAGLGLGVILSQLMSLLVANMFEADMTNFAFTFSKGALIKTCCYFGIMYILVMIFNTRWCEFINSKRYGNKDGDCLRSIFHILIILVIIRINAKSCSIHEKCIL